MLGAEQQKAKQLYTDKAELFEERAAFYERFCSSAERPVQPLKWEELASPELQELLKNARLDREYQRLCDK